MQENFKQTVVEVSGSPFEILEGYFAFMKHQGYIYYFVDCNENSADPVVFGYLEGDPTYKVISESMEDFLINDIRREINRYTR